MATLRSGFKLLGDAANEFIEDNAFKLAASLSYYTVFALAPLLIIIISLTGIFLTPQDVQSQVYQQINSLLGRDAAQQIQQIIINLQNNRHSTAGAIIGGIVLFIGATGVFTEIQGSINFIWSVKAKPRKGWLKYLINRLVSFSLIVGLGFLMLVSLILNALLNLLSDKLTRLFPEYTVSLFQFVNTIVLLVVITGLFTVIFRVLPDATISWKDAFVGSILTAAMFLLGKALIVIYIGQAKLGVTYGTAASVIIILTWVYYSSLILYYGAEFTKVYALNHGEGIRPKRTAVFIIKSESREIPQSNLDT